MARSTTSGDSSGRRSPACWAVWQMNAHTSQKIRDKDVERPSAWAAMRAFGGPKESKMTQIFGLEGPFAKSFPGYQPRAAQVGLAEAIYQGLSTGQHVVAEAGTGTGKSHAGLVPAIVHTMEKGGAKANHRILVSTAMIILQDQYTKKDLPWLEEHLGLPFEWTKRKGRSNYPCEVRVGNAERDRLPFAQRPLFDQVWSWMGSTVEGDLSELPFDVNRLADLKKAITIKGSNCKARKCASFDQCFYYCSKDRAVNCEIIVVNHALLVLNAMFDGMILPEYDAVIIDEAHKLENIVRDNLAEELSFKGFMDLLDEAESLELFSAEKLAEMRSSAELNLDSIENTLARLVKYPGKHRFAPGTLPESFKAWLVELRDLVAQVFVAARRMAESTDDEDGGPKDLTIAAESMGQAIRAFIDQDPSFVVWGDRKKGKEGEPDKLTLCQAPIKVASWMKANLLQKTCVFLSATLATSRGESAFVPFKEAMGIERAIELQVNSPFDYVRNARYSLGYYPRGPEKPPSDQSEWSALIFPRIELVLDLTKGGALVLFTARKVMDEVYHELSQVNNGRWLLLKQDEMSKANLIEQFKAGVNSVLCATQSFFEGVDIPGDALRCVIIDKIPFPSPSDPVQEAISASYGKRDGFKKHWIPHAITHLKQGVGRLIRCETDRGLLALLDPRMRSAGYADLILSQLPGYSYAAQAEEIESFMRDICPDVPRAELAHSLPLAEDVLREEGFSG